VNLSPIDKPITASQLRDRALAAMNGEARALSKTDAARRARVLAALRKGSDAA
jgi:hypothetical protein